mmetsp:Transcript_9815/g.11288  ORF Transcript_9815/g.11288 Transcript_9815/m.11288 type:complete len:156 (-) Transcript_9815:334-801(-)
MSLNVYEGGASDGPVVWLLMFIGIFFKVAAFCILKIRSTEMEDCAWYMKRTRWHSFGKRREGLLWQMLKAKGSFQSRFPVLMFMFVVALLCLDQMNPKKFNHLRSSLPTWNGGSVKAKTIKAKVEHDETVQSEVRYLKIALLIGAIIQIALFCRK